MNADDVRRLIPARCGSVEDIRPIHTGLSGASVWEVTTDAGAFVLRIGGAAGAERWARETILMRRAAEARIAPALEWQDERIGATLTRRIGGPGFAAALSDPVARPRALASLVEAVGRLHSLSTDGLPTVDPVTVARSIWRSQESRPGFPAWIVPALVHLARAEELLARDRRRVTSHNDLNPANVLWDGERAWLVDWEQAGLSHPYYDIAALSTFLIVDDDGALGLLARQEEGVVTDPETFVVIRRLAMVLYGVTFFGLSGELAGVVPPAIDPVPSIAECYAMLGDGRLSMRDTSFQALYGAALLKRAMH